MATRLQTYGVEERVAAGTLLFQRGQRSVDFFFVLEGKVEVFERNQDGTPHVFTVLAERQFTGELDLFNDREILVSSRAATECRVVRVTRANFRRLVSGEPDIGEIILRCADPAPRGPGAACAGRGHAGRPRPWRRNSASALPDPQQLSAPGAR